MIPHIENIVNVIGVHWKGFASELIPVSTTIRLFRVKKNNETFLVRVSFDRRDFKASEVIEFIDYLSKSGCPVPRIVPTNDGQLFTTLQDTVISIESELPGVDCGSKRIDILQEVGKGLAKIHSASAKYPKLPAQFLPLHEYVRGKFERALRRNLLEDERNSITKLYHLLTEDFSDRLDLSICWIITHGDVRGPNVLVEGKSIGFTDIYSTFAPALADLVMLRDKWLLGDPDGNGRYLDLTEISDFLRGYTSVRSLSQEERDTFGIVWAAWGAEKLSHFATNKKVGGARRDFWNFHQKLLQLPEVLSEADLLLR